MTKINDKNSDIVILNKHVLQILNKYFMHLDGVEPVNLYSLVLKEVEVPLLKSVLNYSKNNQTKAASILGLSRVTLRKKLKQYNLIEKD